MDIWTKRHRPPSTVEKVAPRTLGREEDPTHHPSHCTLCGSRLPYADWVKSRDTCAHCRGDR